MASKEQHRTDREERDEMTNREANDLVPCPECGAATGEKCKTKIRPLTKGNVMIHYERWKAATKAAFDAKQPR